jgi:transposase-like protein
MRKQSPKRNPLFAKRWFQDDVIILCVRWYLRFRLSYRDLASIVAEMGIAVAPSTILRWVVRYTGEFVRCWAPFEMVVGRSWRADETYIKVKGAWMFLYRAVDERGRTVASYLSRTRDQTAARNFQLQILEQHCGAGSPPSEVPHFCNAGLQVLPECQNSDRRNRTHPEAKERTVRCPLQLRFLLARYLDQRARRIASHPAATEPSMLCSPKASPTSIKDCNMPMHSVPLSG